jgi:hypothetical protein
VKKCSDAGKLNGRLGTGLYQLLKVAAWKNIFIED